MNELDQLEQVRSDIAFSMIEANPQELEELEQDLAEVEFQIAQLKGEVE